MTDSTEQLTFGQRGQARCPVKVQILGWLDPGVAPALHMQPFVLPWSRLCGAVRALWMSTGQEDPTVGCGVVAVTVDHRLHSLADYPTAAIDVASAVQQARTLTEVDADRVALWFFSGGGLLTAD